MSVQDGRRSSCQLMKCHQAVPWKARAGHEFESLLSFKTVLALYDLDVLQKDMPSS